jgi:membrane associated rhomboid family serine protease
MMPLTTILILLLTAAVSFIAFQRRDLWERLMFKPTEILRDKQFERMVSSGLIHLDWAHLGWNSLSFYLFGRNIEAVYGPVTLLAVYLAGIVGGSILSLIVHRHEAEYRALVASGGVCGLIFASIFLLPDSAIYFFLLPIGIPPYLYALIFLVTSFIAHRRRSDNIGHDAHLGGAIVGLLVATAMYPHLVFAEPWMFAIVLLLSIGILVVLIRDPGQMLEFRLSEGRRPKSSQRYQRYDEAQARREKMEEIDRLLDKVAAQGIHSLSRRERKKLDQLSKEIGRQR